MPLPKKMGRTGSGLGHDLHAHGGNRDSRLRNGLRLRRGGGAGLRCDYPPRHGRTEGKIRQTAPEGRSFCGGVPDGTPGRLRLFRSDDQSRRHGRLLPHQRAKAIYRRRRGSGLLSAVRQDGLRSQNQAAEIHHRVYRGPRSGCRDEISLRPDGLPRRRNGASGFQGRQSAESQCRRQGQRRL